MKPLSSIFGGGAFSAGSGVGAGYGSATATVAVAEPATGSTAAAVPRVPTIEELKRQLCQVAQGLRALHGDRAAVIIAIGVPNGAHDRFAAYATGPCLMERGLLHWAVPALEEQMDAHVTEPPNESTAKEGTP